MYKDDPFLNIFGALRECLGTLKCKKFAVKFWTPDHMKWHNFDKTSFADDVFCYYQTMGTLLGEMIPT